MKIKFLAVVLAALLFSTSIFAQRSEKQDSYSYFGHTPYIIGAERENELENAIFVIENTADGTRLEQYPRKGIVRLFDSNGKLIKETQLKEHERAWGVPDPKAEKYKNTSPYAYCNNNPVRYIDPKGMSWIEGKNGVFWDPNINSQKDFEKNYANKTGFTYVSDADNAKSYTLPSGAGKLIMNEWDASNRIEDGVGGVSVDISFISADGNAEVGWTQTFSSNIPDVTESNEYSALPAQAASERLDGFGVQQSSDVSQARYFDGFEGYGTPNSSLIDSPRRTRNSGAKYGVSFDAQSTVLVNGERAASLGWGFTVNSKRRQTVSTPMILNTTTPFHNKAVQSLSNKIRR